MESFCLIKFNLNFELVQQRNTLMAFFLLWKSNCLESSSQHCCKSSCKYGELVRCCDFTFCPVQPKPTQWGLRLETLLVFHHLKVIVFFLFFESSSNISWRYVLGHYMAVTFSHHYDSNIQCDLLQYGALQIFLQRT